MVIRRISLAVLVLSLLNEGAGAAQGVPRPEPGPRSVTLAEALVLLAAKSGKSGGKVARIPAKSAAKSPAKVATKVATKAAAKVPAKVARGVATKVSAAKTPAPEPAKTVRRKRAA